MTKTDIEAAAERDRWIEAFGSSRLKKALAAGIAESVDGGYLSDRVHAEYGPKWVPFVKSGMTYGDRIEPSEAEVDALIAARKERPQAECQLGFCLNLRTNDWAPALMERLPWAVERWAIRFLR